MRKLNLFFILSLILFPALAEAKLCIDDNRTKCAQLGYTKPVGSCGSNTGVACPYDPTKWFCTEWTCEDGRWFDAMDTTYWTTCNTVWYKTRNCWDCKCAETSPDCAIGDIFFSDGTCSDQYGLCMGKIPVGVVYMLTDAQGNIVNSERSLHGRAINLNDLKSTNQGFDPANPYSGSTNIGWGLYYSNVPSLTAFNSSDILLSAFRNAVGVEGSSEIYNGKNNTAKIEATVPAPTEPWVSCSFSSDQANYYTNSACGPAAAHAALLFYPHSTLKNNATVGAGKWYLPSIGEFAQLYGLDVSSMNSGFGNSGATGTTFDTVNNTLGLLSRKNINTTPISSYYWTSTPYDAQNVVIMASNGNRNHDPKNTNDKIRVSLEFHNAACTSRHVLTTCPTDAICSTCLNGKKKIDSCQMGYVISADGSACEPAPCKIGDIYYADGTCSDTDHYNSGKIPVGVVYMLTDAAGNIVDTERSLHGRVINLKDLKTTNKKFDPENPYSGSSNMNWGLYYSNVSTVTNFNSDSALLAAFKDSVGAEGIAEIYNGKGNTAKIDATTPAPVQYWISCSIAPEQEGYYTNHVCGPAAAHNTLLFYPHPDLKTNPKVGAGQWYLPSIGEMAQLYGLDVSAMTSGFGNSGFTGTTFNHINNTLQLLSNKGIDAEPMTSYYWTSTPYDAENTIAIFLNGYRGNDPKNTNDKVRASLQF